jgi:3-(3-hydroxy-phenyl)propionate hydroxylase
LTSFINRDREFGGGVVAGGAAINRKISGDDYLLDHLGAGFTGLYFTRQAHVPEPVRELFRELVRIDTRFRALVVASAALSQSGIDVIEDRDGSIFEGYAALDDSFYLLRPDRHVAARWLRSSRAEAVKALSIALSR